MLSGVFVHGEWNSTVNIGDFQRPLSDVVNLLVSHNQRLHSIRIALVVVHFPQCVPIHFVVAVERVPVNHSS